MKDCKYIAAVFSLIFCMPTYAITIGNFKAEGAMSGYFLISDLDDASYLDVQVEIDGTPVNYVLEQISDDRVRVIINDPLLDQQESLIEISVNSDLDTLTRSFAYRNEAATTSIRTKTKAAAALVAARQEGRKKLIVPALDNISDSGSPGELKGGVLHINITKGQTSVGTAVEHLARAENLNVLILPGDRGVHDVLLTGSVSEFADLHAASDTAVEHVYIDRVNHWVRIVGVGSETESQTSLFDNQPTAKTTIGQLLKDIAQVNGYTALIYPGDAETLLNTQVNWKGRKNFHDLGMLVAENGGRLDIDRTNRLIRASKLQ